MCEMDPPDNVHCTPHIKLTGAAAEATVGGREACGPFCCILQPRNMRFFLLFLLLCLIHRFLMSGTYSLEFFFFFSLSTVPLTFVLSVTAPFQLCICALYIIYCRSIPMFLGHPIRGAQVYPTERVFLFFSFFLLFRRPIRGAQVHILNLSDCSGIFYRFRYTVLNAVGTEL